MQNYKKITKLIHESSLDENLKQYYQSSADYLNKKCGCKLGAACMLCSFLGIIGYNFFYHTFLIENWSTNLFYELAMVILCAILGKITGLLIAKIQMEILQRAIKMQITKTVSCV